MAPFEKVKSHPRHGLQGIPVDPIYRNRDQILKVLDLFTERLCTNERTTTKNWTNHETFEVFSLKAAFHTLDETKLEFIRKLNAMIVEIDIAMMKTQ